MLLRLLLCYRDFRCPNSILDVMVLPNQEKENAYSPTKSSIDNLEYSHVEHTPAVGRDHIADTIPPHESYEGFHRYDPKATWRSEEEAKVVRKTDLYLLSWICLMVT